MNRILIFAAISSGILTVAAVVATKLKRNKGTYMTSPEWKTKQATEQWLSER